MNLRRTLAASVTTCLLAVGLGVGVAAPASALSHIIGPIGCTTNTYIWIKSTTKGATYHLSSDGRQWYKGTFSYATATKTGTGRSSLTYVQVNAPTISSASYTCA
jgi:hypothetical protein